jgi:hypothetical protein
MTFGRPSRRQNLTYGEIGHIHAEFDRSGRLVVLTVEHVGKQDKRLYRERRGAYKAVLEDMTAKFGPPSSIQEDARNDSHPVASWFISPHTEITFEGSNFGDGVVQYSYVERASVADTKDQPNMPTPAPAVGATTAALPASPQTDPDKAARLKSITETLQRPYTPYPEVPIPEQLWKDLGVAPTDTERKASANALRLSNGPLPELLVENSDPDVCGSSGCPWRIQGPQSEVNKDGKVAPKYKTLLESHGAVYVLDSVTNGYRDLLIDGGDGTAIMKYDGTLYKAAECFSRGHNNLDDIRPSDCQLWTAK